ncbi:unannotated protein [freshwater metagenome]|uniref:Unannotated protein n=1 Tax=freshwater metagenome TaxID=449393 RepID=A0A6J5YIL1_9ZZZZ
MLLADAVAEHTSMRVGIGTPTEYDEVVARLAPRAMDVGTTPRAAYATDSIETSVLTGV